MASTENIGRMLVVGVVFFAVIAVLLGLQATEQNAYTPNPASPSTLIGGESYTFLIPVAGHDFTWTNASVSYYHAKPATDIVTFYMPDESGRVRASVMRNRTVSQGWFQEDEWFQHRDFIAVEQSWGLWSWAGVSIDLRAVLASHNATPSLDYVDVNITLMIDYVVRVTASSAASFVDDVLVNNTFNVKVLYITFDPSVLDPDGAGWLDYIWLFVTTVINLLLPNTLPAIPYIGWPLQIGLWMAGAYVFYMLLVRGWHGGG